MRPTTLLRDAATSTLAAMTAARVSRLLVVSSALLFPGGGVRAGFFAGSSGITCATSPPWRGW
jgi:hypothetical protein